MNLSRHWLAPARASVRRPTAEELGRWPTDVERNGMTEIRGTWYAASVPFGATGSLDHEGQQRLEESVVALGVDGLTVMGVMARPRRSHLRSGLPCSSDPPPSRHAVPIAVGCAARVHVRLSPEIVVVTLDGTELARHRRSFVPADVVLDPAHARALRLAREARGRLEGGDVEVQAIDLSRYDRLVGVGSTGPSVDRGSENDPERFPAARFGAEAAR